MRAEVADQLEAFVEAGALWDDQAVTDLVGDGAGQLLLAFGSAGVLALLSVSLRTFPSPELPPLRSGPSGSSEPSR